MPRPFLTASWTNLAIVTYAVPPALLQRHVPSGLDLDTRNGDAFVSLVAFDFIDTRVFGIPWPSYCRFPELNLRFYVRRGTERGIVFVREFVQKRAVAWLAKLFYNERYVVAPIERTVAEQPERITTVLQVRYGEGLHTISVTGRKPSYCPQEHSDEHFFKEHRWGFGVDRRGRGLCYEVVHPPWHTYPVESYRVDMDWGRAYGPEWRPLGGQTPCSVVLAAGSPVILYPKCPIS